MLTKRQTQTDPSNEAGNNASSTSNTPLQQTTGTNSYNTIYTYLDLGNRLPQFLTNHTAHVPGIPTWDLLQVGGVGTLMEKAEAAASQHKSQIARFYVGHLTVAYLRNPEHIAKVYRDKNPANPHEKPANGDSFGIYPYLFGPSILSYLETDPRYKEERKFYTTNLTNALRLDDACNVMSIIMEAQLQKQSPTSITTITELRRYVNRTIITMVAQTQLGLIDLTDDEKDQLAELVETMLPQIINLKNIAYFKMEEKFGYRPHLALDKIREEGYQFLQSLLNRNQDHILKEPANSDNELFLRKFLRKIAAEKNITLEQALKEQSQNFSAIVLFAGYESTSTSTFFNLMLLADPNHQEYCEQVRQDILQHWDGSKPLTREDIKKMPVLDSAVREGLRLYPPFPTFKDILPTDVTLDGVLLKQGTVIFISPLRVHRTDRQNNVVNASNYELNRKLSETDPTYKLMTFGYEPRICPGRNLSMLDSRIVLAYLLLHFDFNLLNLHHPFDVKEVYSLHLADSVNPNEKVSFTPRNEQVAININACEEADAKPPTSPSYQR